MVVELPTAKFGVLIIKNLTKGTDHLQKKQGANNRHIIESSKQHATAMERFYLEA